MYRQIVTTNGQSIDDVEASLAPNAARQNSASGPPCRPITLADVSMSLDNVLAVAGAAKGSTLVLVIGLAVAIVLMAVASHYHRQAAGHSYPWIAWIGLLIILWVALDMIYGLARGDVQGLQVGCSETCGRHPAPIGAR